MPHLFYPQPKLSTQLDILETIQQISIWKARRDARKKRSALYAISQLIFPEAPNNSINGVGSRRGRVGRLPHQSGYVCVSCPYPSLLRCRDCILLCSTRRHLGCSSVGLALRRRSMLLLRLSVCLSVKTNVLTFKLVHQSNCCMTWRAST